MPVPEAGQPLPDCPKSRNCVCSQASAPGRRVEPFPLRGTPEESLALLRKAIETFPRATVIEQTDHGLAAEFRTRWLRFVDDFTAITDETEKVIHIRSASRWGYSDFGVNRRRVEKLRDIYLELPNGHMVVEP